MGKRKGRNINGIVLLDKALGGSSNHVLQQVKRLYGAAKAGHTGALDPLASGMLPICLGEATKFSQFLLDADKQYVVTATLGIRTTTSDADGEVVAEKPVSVSTEQLQSAVDTFKGPINQVPSMFSALKYQGKPLYHYARQGIDIDRPARDITVFSIDITRFEGNEVDLVVHCSKGTYIRSLVDDLGQLLGCGAFVSRLHRTHVADYPQDKMLTIEALQALFDRTDETPDYTRLDDFLLPMDTAVASLPSVIINGTSLTRFSCGNPVAVNCGCVGMARVYAKDSGLFLGVAECDGVNAQPKRLVVYPEAIN